jgi:hypothetical protein
MRKQMISECLPFARRVPSFCTSSAFLLHVTITRSARRCASARHARIDVGGWRNVNCTHPARARLQQMRATLSCSDANRRRIDEPPFRPRHAATTAESAAARLHLRRTRRGAYVYPIRNAARKEREGRMSRGYGKRELAILAVVEAWSPFQLMELLRGEYTPSRAEALKRAARGLAKKGKIALSYDDQGRIVIRKASREGHGVLVDGVVELYPDAPPLKPGQRLLIKVGDDKFRLIVVGRKLNREPLSLEEANRLMGRLSQGRAPEWGERERELDKKHIEDPSVDSTRGWRHGKADADWEEALLKKAFRIVDDRKDFLKTQQRLERERAFWEAHDDDERRGQKRRKGLRPRGDEDGGDDVEGSDMLPDEKGRRAVDAASAIATVDGQDDVNRLLEQPTGTLEQSEEDLQKQAAAEEVRTEQERQLAIRQDEWKDEGTLRSASLEPPAPDPDYDEPDDEDK